MNYLFNLASASRCQLWDKEVVRREKDLEIKELKEKVVHLVRQVEMQKAALNHLENLQVCLCYISNCPYFFKHIDVLFAFGTLPLFFTEYISFLILLTEVIYKETCKGQFSGIGDLWL